jgi:tagatose 6-phosphate kinase
MVIVVGGFNSAVDKLADIDSLQPGSVLRLRNVRAEPGGKGLHVALACATLGEPTRLVGLIDPGNLGLFDRVLSSAGVRFVGVPIDQSIRTCLAVRDADGRTTELLEPGPTVSEGVAAALTNRFLDEASAAGVVVLSGSLPAGLRTETYARLIAQVGSNRVLLDTSGEALVAGLGAGPLAVKPNRYEASDVVGFEIDSLETATRAAEMIGGLGPRIVIISLGSDGAVVWSAGHAFAVRPPVMDARNAVGAGDCLLGGFAVGLLRGWSVEECARYAVACGSAKVSRPETGMLRRSDVEALLPAVTITPIRSMRTR